MEEEEIITQEETFDYHKLRYILNSDGYICHASIGGLIVCDLGECTEYVGEVPSGYETIAEWYDEEIDKLNAWKIIDDNLVFDEKKCNELQEQCKQDEIDNSCVTRKEMFGLQKEIEDIQDINNSQYTEASADGKIITIDNVKKVYPRIKIKNIDCYKFDKVDLIVSNKNILPNEAVTQEISGVTFTQNEDRSITINGAAIENIEYNLAGANDNISPILMLKKDTNYYLSSNNYQIKMYNFDGNDRDEIYSGTGGLIKFTDEDKPITHIVLCIEKGTTIKKVTVYPQLDFDEETDYVEHQSNRVTIDFSEYIEDGLFPSDNLFPSDELFPKGTTISYILIENGKTYIKVNETEEEVEVGKIHLFDGYNTIYTMQDTNIEIEYCINNLKLEGTVTKNNNFKVLEDGSIEAHNGSFSGNIYLTNGGSIVSDKGLLISMTIESNIKSNQFMGGNIMLPMGYSMYGENLFNKDALVFEFTIPKNFYVKNAFITIQHMPVEYREMGNLKYVGYSRNLKLYKGSNFINGIAQFDMGYYTLNNKYIAYNEIESAFGDDGFTGSDTEYTKQKSIDIKEYITTSKEEDTFNIFKIETGNNLITTMEDKFTHSGSCKATLIIQGYTSFE